LTGNITAFNFNGNVVGGNGAFLLLTADAVIADTFNGDLHGNVFGGNVIADTGTFNGNLSAANITTGNISFDTQTSNEANIGNIHISRSNIHEFGSGNDNFVIDSERSNIVIQGANVATLNVDAPYVMIRGGNVTGIATGGNVIIESGDGGPVGKAGTLTLKGGEGGVGNDGGNIDILGGNSGTGGDGGTINIISGVTYGDPSTLHGSNLYLQAGNSVNEDAGTLFIQGGNAVGALLNGGNVRITAGTGTQINGNVYIGNIRWPQNPGTTGQSLITDGTGNSSWALPVVSNISNGTSNVQVFNNGNVTVSVGGNANVLTITGNTVLSNSYTSNSYTLGDATTTACVTRWVKTQTTTAAANQVLFTYPAGLQVSTDFKIIVYDIPASNRQSSQITSVTYGMSSSYSEYARTVINTVIADFSVDQLSGNIRLLVTPRVAHLINYTIIVSIY
jgi:hypothetical protein